MIRTGVGVSRTVDDRIQVMEDVLVYGSRNLIVTLGKGVTRKYITTIQPDGGVVFEIYDDDKWMYTYVVGKV